MRVEQKVNIHNRFDIHIDNIETGEHRELVAYNIVLDQMWTRLCAGDNYFSNIHFGAGNGVPVANRTSLFTHLGTKTAVTEETIKALPLSSWKRKIVLNPEEFVGSTITEVGIAFGSTASNLVTHAMLKDSEGNVISITKSDTDVVTIFATVFITFANNIPELKLIGMPSNNQLINYLTGGSAPTGSFGLGTIENPYSKLGTTATATWTSDVPNRKRKTNIPRFGTTVGNGIVKYLDFTNLFSLKLPAPGIFTGQPYTGVNLGSGGGVQRNFMISSAYAKSESISIKKNGIVVTDYIKDIKIQENNSRISNPSSLPANTGYGVALTPDGLIMAVAHYTSPFVTTYDWVEGAWVKRPDPSSLPTGIGRGVALTPDGLVMAVAHQSSRNITTYDWVGGAWVKRPDPSSLPTDIGRGVALTPDGLIMAVAHQTAPFITTYDWVEGAWVKRPNPSSLPTNVGQGVALTPDGLIMAVAHETSPFITTYDWVGGAWVKRPNPSSLPAYHGYGVALTPDGLVMAVAHVSSPYITTYMGIPFTQITFDTPPTLGDVITADYTVDGVHKTDQYVIDVSFAIQFGEG